MLACEAVEAVRIVESATVVRKARGWIPPELQGMGYSFFGENDWWHYMGIADEKLCPMCASYDGQDYRGDELRVMWPYLEIDTWNVIRPVVHTDTCRCLLVRSLLVEEGVDEPVLEPPFDWNPQNQPVEALTDRIRRLIRESNAKLEQVRS